jgi:hypothetical protein
MMGSIAARLVLDDIEDASLVVRNEDAPVIFRIVAALSLLDIDPLDRTADECLGAINDVPQGVPVVTNRPPGAGPVDGDDGALEAELLRS